ncbi:MAG TPA: TIGR01777 family oxidoreductase [Ktedonobacterales bacterium]
MRVLITGGAGLLGKPLARLLADHGHEVIVLSRNPARAARAFERSGPSSVRIVGWDGHTGDGWGALITSSVVVNLAGATPAHWRWTSSYRERILGSRLHASEAILHAIARHGPPDILIQASASGYYGDRGDEILTEASSPGRGFRAEVCSAWEASTAAVPARRCVLRTGIVLAREGGAFPPLLLFTRLLGRRLGTGRQWLPWVHHVDVAHAIEFLIERPALSGPFNLCAPEPAQHAVFMRSLHRVLRRPGLIALPAWALRLALGELSSVVLDSQRMAPRRLLEAGFTFAYPQLDGALRHLLRAERA